MYFNWFMNSSADPCLVQTIRHARNLSLCQKNFWQKSSCLHFFRRVFMNILACFLLLCLLKLIRVYSVPNDSHFNLITTLLTLNLIFWFLPNFDYSDHFLTWFWLWFIWVQLPPITFLKYKTSFCVVTLPVEFETFCYFNKKLGHKKYEMHLKILQVISESLRWSTVLT